MFQKKTIHLPNVLFNKKKIFQFLKKLVEKKNVIEDFKDKQYDYDNVLNISRILWNFLEIFGIY